MANNWARYNLAVLTLKIFAERCSENGAGKLLCELRNIVAAYVC